MNSQAPSNQIKNFNVLSSHPRPGILIPVLESDFIMHSNSPTTCNTEGYQSVESSSFSFSDIDEETEKEKGSKKLGVSPTEQITGTPLVSENLDRASFWTEENIKLLMSLAVSCKRDWKKVAKKFNNKLVTASFAKCKYRELTTNQPPLRVRFSHEEDILIAKYINIYGCDWDKISEFFVTRTPVMLKNRYYSYIRKKNLLRDLSAKPEGLEGPETDNKKELAVECSTSTQSLNTYSNLGSCLGMMRTQVLHCPLLRDPDDFSILQYQQRHLLMREINMNSYDDDEFGNFF